MNRPRRPPLALPGEVWRWEGNNAEFYILREDHRSSRGQMHEGLNLHTGAREDCFFSYDPFNGWQKIS